MPFCRRARVSGNACKERCAPVPCPMRCLSFAVFALAVLALHFSSSWTSPTSAIDYVVLGRTMSPGVRSANPIRPSGNRVHSVDLSESRCAVPMASTVSGLPCNFNITPILMDGVFRIGALRASGTVVFDLDAKWHLELLLQIIIIIMPAVDSTDWLSYPLYTPCVNS